MKHHLKNFQLWLNQHYEGVRFYIGIVTMIVVIVVLLGQNAALEEQIEETKTQDMRQAEAILKVLGALDKNTQRVIDDGDKRTGLIICLLAIHGESNQISEEDKARCQQVADNEIENIESNTNNSRPTSEPTSSSPSQAPAPPQEPPPPPVDEGILPDSIPIIGGLL